MDPAMPPQKSCFRASMARESFRFGVVVVVVVFEFALPTPSVIKDDDDGGDCGPELTIESSFDAWWWWWWCCCFPSSSPLLFKRLVIRLTMGCGD
jgi:hypothetical protein